ncbi:hypothetical protein AAVH_15347 [Aphelenchoides avenae]|nr:hypothetical protein AAVH_15347 [Aphelenchus avenae]
MGSVVTVIYNIAVPITYSVSKGITDAANDFAGLLQNFADATGNFPLASKALARIGQNLPESFHLDLHFALPDEVMQLMPYAFAQFVGLVAALFVTLFITCECHKLMDWKIRRDELALLRAVNELERLKAELALGKDVSKSRRRSPETIRREKVLELAHQFENGNANADSGAKEHFL